MMPLTMMLSMNPIVPLLLSNREDKSHDAIQKKMKISVVVVVFLVLFVVSGQNHDNSRGENRVASTSVDSHRKNGENFNNNEEEIVLVVDDEEDEDEQDAARAEAAAVAALAAAEAMTIHPPEKSQTGGKSKEEEKELEKEQRENSSEIERMLKERLKELEEKFEALRERMAARAEKMSEMQESAETAKKDAGNLAHKLGETVWQLQTERDQSRLLKKELYEMKRRVREETESKSQLEEKLMILQTAQEKIEKIENLKAKKMEEENESLEEAMRKRLFSKKELQSLREEVREMFFFAWKKYLNNAFPFDELAPLTCQGRNIFGDLGYSLTLIDGMDTLAVMGNLSDFAWAVEKTVDSINFNIDANVSVFETIIRALGGLLSSHLLALRLLPLSYDGRLLPLAHDLGNRLLPAFNTPSGIPYGTINLKRGVPHGETPITSAAGGGTNIIEFVMLSRLTGDHRFEQAARKALHSLWSRRSSLGLVGNHINVLNGQWTHFDSGIGTNVDSFYEYLAKAHFLFGDKDFLLMFFACSQGISQFLKKGDLFVDANMHSGTHSWTVYSSLASFWPSIQVMFGAIDRASKMQTAVHRLWQRWGGIPEGFNIDTNSPHPGSEGYPLRPESIESLMYLHEATGDPMWLVFGLDVLASLQMHRVPCGFAGTSNVASRVLANRMDSYFFSETCKYLFLLFDPDNPFRSSNYIFNTEGHPFAVSDARALLLRSHPLDDGHAQCPVQPYTQRIASLGFVVDARKKKRNNNNNNGGESENSEADDGSGGGEWTDEKITRELQKRGSRLNVHHNKALQRILSKYDSGGDLDVDRRRKQHRQNKMGEQRKQQQQQNQRNQQQYPPPSSGETKEKEASNEDNDEKASKNNDQIGTVGASTFGADEQEELRQRQLEEQKIEQERLAEEAREKDRQQDAKDIKASGKWEKGCAGVANVIARKTVQEAIQSARYTYSYQTIVRFQGDNDFDYQSGCRYNETQIEDGERAAVLVGVLNRIIPREEDDVVVAPLENIQCCSKEQEEEIRQEQLRRKKCEHRKNKYLARRLEETLILLPTTCSRTENKKRTRLFSTTANEYLSPSASTEEEEYWNKLMMERLQQQEAPSSSENDESGYPQCRICIEHNIDEEEEQEEQLFAEETLAYIHRCRAASIARYSDSMLRHMSPAQIVGIGAGQWLPDALQHRPWLVRHFVRQMHADVLDHALWEQLMFLQGSENPSWMESIGGDDLIQHQRRALIVNWMTKIFQSGELDPRGYRNPGNYFLGISRNKFRRWTTSSSSSPTVSLPAPDLSIFTSPESIHPWFPSSLLKCGLVEADYDEDEGEEEGEERKDRNQQAEDIVVGNYAEESIQASTSTTTTTAQ